MNHQHIADLSAKLIIMYYNNEYMPFLLAMDDEALWYGPAEGQFLQGREKMIKAWQAEEHNLRFTMGNLKVRHIAAHTASCEVMLTYTVVTHYPDGHDISVFQRLHLSWCERKQTNAAGKVVKEPKILFCHISNPHGMHEDDTIYVTNYANVLSGNNMLLQRGERLHFHGTNHSDYFFLSDSVFWIEATAGGKHSILHTAEEAIEVMRPVSALEKDYGHLFLRCHQSYLINPHYVRKICRFRLTLTDGTELPIPEKKYTAFCKAVQQVLKH
ncbi:MAG: LytTR family transcriptional regulator DNA-binding domain-containing protein [Clostridia bacterium]|nr:LytTR family transcriptional regulator DNA-binding domain-containing protein [Clostridia bacterium]